MTQHPSPFRRGLFMSDDANRSRMPTALLTGFLGSGKTTLINTLLRDPRLEGTAVAVNEFGAVPLDQHLIEHGGDRTVVLANGCLCCNLAGDMEEGIMRLFSRRAAGALPRFARLIVEPSGLADPAPIAQAILRNPVMSRALRLDAIVTTIDCVFAEAQFARHPETRKQAALADRVVLTKGDLADADTVARARRVVRGHNHLAPIAEARDGAVDAAWLFPPEFLDPEAPPLVATRSPLMAEHVAADAHGGDTHALSLGADAPLRWEAFDAWLRGIRIAHAEQLLRVKALLHIEGADGPVAVHGVHHVMHAPVALERWPDAARTSRIVMTTQGGVGETIRASWERALPGLLAPAKP